MKKKNKIEDIKKDFSELRHSLRHGFSKSKINEFIRSLYNIKIQKYLTAPKKKGDLKKLGEVDEDYYKPIKAKSSFNGNYIEYESKGVKDKNLSPREYLDIIRPYLSNMINDHKTIREWKIQLTVQINFISRKDSEETRTMHKKCRNIESWRATKQIKLSKNFCNLFYKIIKKKLEEPMRGSEFVRGSIDLLYYHLQKVSLKRSGSYIDSPEWLKNKKTTTNPQNNDNNCFKYALTRPGRE